MNVEDFKKKTANNLKILKKLIDARDKLEKAAKKQAVELKKLNNAVVALKGFSKGYMDAVKNTDGLISVAPSCMKALQDPEKQATEKNVSLAIKTLEEQKKLALKQVGNDKDKKKQADQFTKALDGMIKQLGALV